MGKFNPNVSRPTPVAGVTPEAETEAEDKSEDLLRAAERRRRGRRATILANIDEEEAKLATTDRPTATGTASQTGQTAARQPQVLLG